MQQRNLHPEKVTPDIMVYAKRMDNLHFVSQNAKNIKNALPFLYGEDVDDQTIANAIRNYRQAWKNQKELHTGTPTYKKKSYEQSYQTNAHYYPGKDGKMTSNVRCYGLSIHEAASFCIARRGQGLTEKLPKQLYILLSPENQQKSRMLQWKAAYKLIKSRKTSDFYQYSNPYTYN